MRLLLAIILLAGCDPSPVTTTVSRDQDYTMPTRYTVDVRVVDPTTLLAMCRGSSEIGCQVWDSPSHASIYLSAAYPHRDHAMSHEFAHLIYGPLHR